jgi:hypothetical protein
MEESLRMSRKQRGSGSTILMDEYYGCEDPRFLEELRAVNSGGKLAGLADRWTKDRRPWAREQLFAYVDLPMNCQGHHVLVKRIFKYAEEKQDDEMMAAFLSAFDRIVRRKRRIRHVFDRSSQQWWEEEFLATPRNSILHKMTRTYRHPWTGKKITVDLPVKPDSRLFSHHTRSYLRRRAWRYFRHMGYQRPETYPRAIASALRRYREEDVASGENILDSWGLLQACFREDPALEFTSNRVNLKRGWTLAELTPSPRFAHLWRTRESMTILWSLVKEANSRFVRVWAMDMLRREHAKHVSELGPETLLELLDSHDEEVQDFAAELLGSARGLDTTPLSIWLRLVETKNPTALAVVCDVMKKHVNPDRLTLDTMLDFATSRPTPTARMGLEFLKERTIESVEDRISLSRLSQVQCAAVARESTTYALSFFQSPETYDREIVSDFFDSLLPEVRQSAWDAMKPGSAGHSDPLLWFRLLETPFDDVRLKLVDAVEQRARVSFSRLG